MSFPNLVLKSGGRHHSEATGTPVNGNNSFDLGFSPLSAEWLSIEVVAAGPSIASVTFISLSGRMVTLSIVQTGADQVTIRAKDTHSLVR